MIAVLQLGQMIPCRISPIKSGHETPARPILLPLFAGGGFNGQPYSRIQGRKCDVCITFFFYICTPVIMPDKDNQIYIIMYKMFSILIAFLLGFQSMNELHAQDKGQDTKIVKPVTGKHMLGENYGGGKIFWIDETGQHGLIAASADQSAKGIAWNPGKLVVTGANSDGLFSGQTNCEKIVSAQGAGNKNAAQLCLDFTNSSDNVVYSDWYLPSKHELNLLYQQKTVVGGFNVTSGIYWSSTESSANPETSAWEQEFKFGSKHEDDKDLPDQVRCIRKF
jgi:hypothetical protein